MRFITRCLPTLASATNSRSTSRLWLFSAFAIADCSVFLTSCAIRLRENSSVITARPASRPRISPATRSSLRGLVRSSVATASASLSASARSCLGLPMAYFLFAFLSAPWPW